MTNIVIPSTPTPCLADDGCHPPASHRQKHSSHVRQRGVAAAMNCPYAAEPRAHIEYRRQPVLKQGCACTRHTSPQSTRGPKTLHKAWYNAQATFEIFCLTLFAVGGIRCRGIQALSNLPPHLEDLDTLALRSWLCLYFWDCGRACARGGGRRTMPRKDL